MPTLGIPLHPNRNTLFGELLLQSESPLHRGVSIDLIYLHLLDQHSSSLVHLSPHRYLLKHPFDPPLGLLYILAAARTAHQKELDFACVQIIIQVFRVDFLHQQRAVRVVDQENSCETREDKNMARFSRS